MISSGYGDLSYASDDEPGSADRSFLQFFSPMSIVLKILGCMGSTIATVVPFSQQASLPPLQVDWLFN